MPKEKRHLDGGPVMPLVFEQTKHVNGRPAWKVFRDGVFLGRVSHLGGEYRFKDLALFTASELRELAQFIEEARP